MEEKNKEIDYKNTINLPQTDFAMKANLPQKEPLVLKNWEEIDIYKRLIEKSKSSPKYILHDGPPYANGNIHIGHALNKILKDIIVKYKAMSGFAAPYVPGWDCHGLPVEHQLFKELGKRKDEVEQVFFRKKAHDFAMKYANIQREEFKRLGVFGDWQNPYLTLAHSYEAAIIRSFGALVEKGYIYKGCKPVNWCYSCETALAEAEVEYEEHASPSIYVKFEIENANKISEKEKLKSKKLYVVIWTTTPWTLLGNVACAVHPDFTYVLVELESQMLILEKHLVCNIFEKAGIRDYKVIQEIKGSDLENTTYKHPFGLGRGKVVLADYVSLEDGSGIVHTAPGYGAEDFLTGKKYNLDMVMQVDTKGCFFKDTFGFGGMHVLKANTPIVQKLKELGLLLLSGEILHSYPHCWRCKNPIIFRATDQWFMSIDHHELRKKLLAAIKEVKWIPDFGENRISTMIENRPDWCLSRQRLWGVPLPIFYCENCNHRPILDKDLIEEFAKIVDKDGTDSWFIKDADEILPKGYVCPFCSKRNFVKEKDILDVWFDSGVSAQAVLKPDPNLGYPADLYLEGSDQHRGWFQASLIPAMAIDGYAPFKAVLTHGHVVDGEGKKMSKSQGNVIAPQEVIAKLGADVLRLWVASSDYNDDIRISEEFLSRVSESYRKIRNTLKFILGNLYNFDPGKDCLSYAELLEVDRWALSALHNLIKQVNAAYNNFLFYQVSKIIYNFCIIEMSSFYLDILKDRLYTFPSKSKARRSAQTVLYEIASVITRIIAPILSFTAEEAYGFFPGRKEKSIFFSAWPSYEGKFVNERLNNIWRFLFAVRDSVLKDLENARNQKLIGNSLEAKIIIFHREKDTEGLKILKDHLAQLPSIFIVSQVELNSNIDTVALPVYNVNFLKANLDVETQELKIKVENAQGKKCVRCWNYSLSVGSNKNHPKLCERCLANISS